MIVRWKGETIGNFRREFIARGMTGMRVDRRGPGVDKANGFADPLTRRSGRFDHARFVRP